jgi:hypothetical protein
MMCSRLAELGVKDDGGGAVSEAEMDCRMLAMEGDTEAAGDAAEAEAEEEREVRGDVSCVDEELPVFLRGVTVRESLST